MARVPAVFGQGVVSTGVATIVGPVPVGERWYLTRLDVANNGAEEAVVTIYLNTSGAARQWKRARLDAEGGHCEFIVGNAVLLEAGDLISASATLEAAVAFYAAGIREN